MTPATRNTPFVVAVPAGSRFAGIVGVGGRGEGAIEMMYGIAPRWRGQGLASRAVRLAARWVASQPGVRSVEARIGQDAGAGQHVAVNAGFAVAGIVPQFVPATGERFEDLRYVLVTPGH